MAADRRDRVVERHQVDLGGAALEPGEAPQRLGRVHLLEPEEPPERHACLDLVRADLERDVLEHRVSVGRSA
jgi:hypothetical protein